MVDSSAWNHHQGGTSDHANVSGPPRKGEDRRVACGAGNHYESLVTLNQRWAAENRPAVIIKEAPETLEDEDLLEMVNAGLIPLTIVDKHKADFWQQIFHHITVHDAVAVRTGGDIAWAIREGS